jgi:hypothetical protein
MSKRTAAFVIALLSILMMGLCRETVMATWSVDSREILSGLVWFVSLFYIGLDLLRATETSLLYRLVKNNPFSFWDPLTFMRAMGVFFILGSLLFGWVFIGRLLGLIK